MIILYNPKAARYRNRRLPLSILTIAAILEGREESAIVDGNLDLNHTDTISSLIRRPAVEMLAVSVIPGPQTVGAGSPCREIRARFPHVTIVWGGYFATNYTAAVLNADYVDFAVRGQGELTFLELLSAVRENKEMRNIAGLSFRDKGSDRRARHNPERPMKAPDVFPWLPYHRLPVEKYVLP